MRVFDVCSDGLFPATDLEKLRLKHWRFKEMFSYWTYANLDDDDNEDQADPYWATYQMVIFFNDHYMNNFEHGWKVTFDEWIYWGWECDQPGGGHKVDIKPRVFGPDYKCLSAVGVQVTTTFEHVRSKNVNYEMKYTREYGAGAACVIHLCEAASIEGSNRDVIADH